MKIIQTKFCQYSPHLYLGGGGVMSDIQGTDKSKKITILHKIFSYHIDWWGNDWICVAFGALRHNKCNHDCEEPQSLLL